jgi:hypothetical protein
MINELKVILNELKSCYLEEREDKFIAYCGWQLVISKITDELIRKLGGDVSATCASCCGFLYVTRTEEGDKVRYDLYTCYCHPWGDVTVYIPKPKT